jgi:Ni/Co efflux regulator RcnB
MKTRFVALLAVGMFASFSVFAQPHGPNQGRDSGNRARHASPPAHQMNRRPPPPPPRYADHRPPPRIVRIDRRDNWRRGRVLPRTVVYHHVAPERIYAYALPEAPRGHRYVRVASDILLIAIGTGLVIDAFQDLAYY